MLEAIAGPLDGETFRFDTDDAVIISSDEDSDLPLHEDPLLKSASASVWPDHKGWTMEVYDNDPDYETLRSPIAVDGVGVLDPFRVWPGQVLTFGTSEFLVVDVDGHRYER